jgi:hypothetical protein
MMIVVVVVGRQRKAGFYFYCFWERGAGKKFASWATKNKIKNGSSQMIQKDSFFFFFWVLGGKKDTSGRHIRTGQIFFLKSP